MNKFQTYPRIVKTVLSKFNFSVSCNADKNIVQMAIIDYKKLYG